ncbi:hypothetical protein BVC80_8377g7 [Macleaya cordata]|uniref:Uncharacterized protein n=1 Tax=Macleaya cordata TaxID=56857 RepID=A0A200PS32_MACCD|nr:hypothetical protein BVC80_8377g7 [Macleaya cordata]
MDQNKSKFSTVHPISDDGSYIYPIHTSPSSNEIVSTSTVQTSPTSSHTSISNTSSSLDGSPLLQQVELNLADGHMAQHASPPIAPPAEPLANVPPPDAPP